MKTALLIYFGFMTLVSYAVAGFGLYFYAKGNMNAWVLIAWGGAIAIFSTYMFVANLRKK